MRLSLCLLLVVLAVSCHEANAGKVCKAVVIESLTFILRSRDALEKHLRTYSAPEDAVQAKLKVKDCVDKMGYGDKFAVAVALAQILFECGAKGLVEKYFPDIPLGK